MLSLATADINYVVNVTSITEAFVLKANHATTGGTIEAQSSKGPFIDQSEIQPVWPVQLVLSCTSKRNVVIGLGRIFVPDNREKIRRKLH